MWKRRCNSALALFVTILAGGSASAAITYTDRAAFLGDVADSVNYDFEVGSGFPAAPASLTSFAGGTVVLSTDAGDAAASLTTYGAFGQAIGGQLGGAVDNFLPLNLTFAPARYAVGFDDLDLTGFGGMPDEFAIINVAYSNGAPNEQFVVSDGDGDFGTAAFFGIISADPIASLQVYSVDLLASLPGGRANLIDNVVLARVPEPTTVALALFGAAVGAIGIRRRKN